MKSIRDAPGFRTVAREQVTREGDFREAGLERGSARAALLSGSSHAYAREIIDALSRQPLIFRARTTRIAALSCNRCEAAQMLREHKSW
ncbi:MAG: hypothetical protein L0170_09085 [Acidobacteria bacterium]|nr:hypothetical protein [Acidobacteriota bacterium]